MSTENHTNFLGIPSQRSKYHKLKRLLIKSCTENEIQMYSIKIIAQCTLDVFTSYKMYNVMYKFLLFISAQKGDNK